LCTKHHFDNLEGLKYFWYLFMVAPQPSQIGFSWLKLLQDEFDKPYMQELAAFLKAERASGKPIYPPAPLVFNAFCQTVFDDVKVVIVGQDPYHQPGQAHGLSFSVLPGVKSPPSLRNIFQELTDDVHIPPPPHGCLLSWAQQGVMMLNATLTVRDSEPKSHYGKGWEQFTDRVIGLLLEREKPVIFALWGRSAHEKVQNVPQFAKHRQHFLLTAPHPSPYSAHSGFLGCHHFSQINQLLAQSGQQPIDWAVK
jgi:uracil-DNA glycosylase